MYKTLFSNIKSPQAWERLMTPLTGSARTRPGRPTSHDQQPNPRVRSVSRAAVRSALLNPNTSAQGQGQAASPARPTTSRPDTRLTTAKQSPVTVPDIMPQPVVQVFSPHGIEYVFLTLMLFAGAIGVGGILLAVVNGAFTLDVLLVPLSMLLAALPVFAWLFIRLKEAELRNPALRMDASKRKSSQFAQVLAFLTCFVAMVTFLALLFAALGDTFNGSMAKVFWNVLVIELVAGGILYYYWKDEHRLS